MYQAVALPLGTMPPPALAADAGMPVAEIGKNQEAGQPGQPEVLPVLPAEKVHPQHPQQPLQQAAAGAVQLPHPSNAVPDAPAHIQGGQLPPLGELLHSLQVAPAAHEGTLLLPQPAGEKQPQQPADVPLQLPLQPNAHFMPQLAGVQQPQQPSDAQRLRPQPADGQLPLAGAQLPLAVGAHLLPSADAQLPAQPDAQLLPLPAAQLPPLAEAETQAQPSAVVVAARDAQVQPAIAAIPLLGEREQEAQQAPADVARQAPAGVAGQAMVPSP